MVIYKHQTNVSQLIGSSYTQYCYIRYFFTVAGCCSSCAGFESPRPSGAPRNRNGSAVQHPPAPHHSHHHPRQQGGPPAPRPGGRPWQALPFPGGRPWQALPLPGGRPWRALPLPGLLLPVSKRPRQEILPEGGGFWGPAGAAWGRWCGHQTLGEGEAGAA